VRADIDALPIREETGLDFASATNGVMHACNLGQNLGAFGLAGAKPLCEDLPPEAPRAPDISKGWGSLFDGKDCEPAYAPATWDLFSKTYLAAKVTQKEAPSADGFDTSILEQLVADKYQEKYGSSGSAGSACEGNRSFPSPQSGFDPLDRGYCVKAIT